MKFNVNHIYAIGCILFFITVLMLSQCGKKNDPIIAKAEPCKPDTVYLDRPVKPVDEDIPEDKPIPKITKFKVSDIACAWGKWTGVINDIAWSSNDPNILKYELQIYNEESGEWDESWYFDTELELGKCH